MLACQKPLPGLGSEVISQTLLPDWLAWEGTVCQKNFGYEVWWLTISLVVCVLFVLVQTHNVQWILSDRCSLSGSAVLRARLRISDPPLYPPLEDRALPAAL